VETVIAIPAKMVKS